MTKHTVLVAVAVAIVAPAAGCGGSPTAPTASLEQCLERGGAWDWVRQECVPCPRVTPDGFKQRVLVS